MIFVTLGTQDFQFNRLLEMVDRLVSEGVISDEVFAQGGHSSYAPKHYACIDFLDSTEFARRIREARLVIAHAGVGTIMHCLRAGQKLIVVPRSREYAEHVDDHQFEIAEEFAGEGYLLCARDYGELKAAVLAAPDFSASPYRKGANTVDSRIARFLRGEQRRVLMVGSDLSVKGGIVSVLRNYLSYEGWKKTDISFLPTHVEGSARKKVCFFLRALGRLRSLLRGGRFDVVHIHVSERGSFTRKAIVLRMAKKRGCRVILHHHGAEFLEFYQGSGDGKKQWIGRILGEADLNLVLSRRLIPIYEEISPRAKVRCLYNTVSVSGENQYRPEARDITMLGRLEERKGTFDLLEVIRKIDGVLDADIKFNLCGDGDLDRVRERIAQLQISHRIGHLGWAGGEKKTEILRRTMIHVLFSYNEGLPMSILETMGCGIVNVATRVAAIPEVITDGENGFLVEPGDREQLARVLLRVSSDEVLRRDVSERAFACIAGAFSLESGAEKLEQLYESVII